MPNVLVRDIEAATLDRLKKRAATRGRSLQSEVQSILNQAASEAESRSEAEVARIIRSSFKNRKQTDSVELIREDRAR